MRGRSTPATPGPVAALTEAVAHCDVAGIARVLADDVHLAVPPLHWEVSGHVQVVDAVSELFYAFTQIGYQLRQRYLAPGMVTDEAVLEGLHAGPFLGAPPTGTVGQVPVRIMVQHDDVQVTRLDVWPDIGALRRVLEAGGRRIDLTGNPSTAPLMIAALRASIPSAGESKLIVGTSRQRTAPPAGPFPGADLPDRPGARSRSGARTPAGRGGKAGKNGKGGKGGKGSRKEALKTPVPRKVRRRRALAAGAAMLLASAGIVGWVTQGALQKQDVVAAKRLEPTAKTRTATPTPAPSPRRSASTLSADDRLEKKPLPNGGVQFSAQNEVLFDTGRADLQPDVEKTLATVVQAVLTEERYGTIVVAGFTDDQGPASLNQRLSQERANKVAQVLKDELAAQAKGRARAPIQVVPEGRGISRTWSNATAEGRSKNRRVTITLPAVTRS